MYAESDVSSGVDSSPTHSICANTKGNDCGLGKISGSCVHSCFQEVVYRYNGYTDVQLCISAESNVLALEGSLQVDKSANGINIPTTIHRVHSIAKLLAHACK